MRTTQRERFMQRDLWQGLEWACCLGSVTFEELNNDQWEATITNYNDEVTYIIGNSKEIINKLNTMIKEAVNLSKQIMSV